MDAPIWLWIGFNVFVLAMLALPLPAGVVASKGPLWHVKTLVLLPVLSY